VTGWLGTALRILCVPVKKGFPSQSAQDETGCGMRRLRRIERQS